MSGQCGLHVIHGRIRVLVQKTLRGHLPTRCAEAAIRGHVHVTDLLHGVQVLLIAQSFNREYLFACSFHRQCVTGIEWCPIDEHTACAATGSITAPVRPGQTELHRNNFPQRRSGFVFRLVNLSIDVEASGFLRHGCRNHKRRWIWRSPDSCPSNADSRSNSC